MLKFGEALEQICAKWRSVVKTDRLITAQERTEQHVSGLEAALERLAQAQMKTEQRLDALAEARETERRLAELAEAQIQTEQSLSQLIDEHQETRRQLGGLTDCWLPTGRLRL
ncbi:MAG: hypothetical protein R2911_26460 [Caldilineaceae bacterium]